MRTNILAFLLLCFISGINAQDAANGFEAHVGLAFPMGDFASDKVKNINEGRGHAAMGFNVGAKYYSPITSAKGLAFALGLDIFYNPLKSEYREDDIEDIESEGGDVTMPKYINLPLTAGLNYQHPVSETAALYGEFGVGVNYSKMTDAKIVFEKHEEISSFDSKFGFTYRLEAGLLVKNINIALRYNELGSYRYEESWKYEGGGEKESGKEKFKTALPISNLSIVLGLRF